MSPAVRLPGRTRCLVHYDLIHAPHGTKKARPEFTGRALVVSGACRNKDDSIIGQASEGELEREEEKSQPIENSSCFVTPETVVGGDRLAKTTRQLELSLATF